MVIQTTRFGELRLTRRKLWSLKRDSGIEELKGSSFNSKESYPIFFLQSIDERILLSL